MSYTRTKVTPFIAARFCIATDSRSHHTIPPLHAAVLDIEMSFGWPTFERPELYVELELGVFVFTIAVLIRVLKGVQRCVGERVCLNLIKLKFNNQLRRRDIKI